MKDIKEYINEAISDDKFFEKGRLKLGQLCISKARDFYIWFPKKDLELMDNFDCAPNFGDRTKGGAFLCRDPRNKGRFACALGFAPTKGFACYDKLLRWKGMEHAYDTIVKVYKNPIPKNILTSRTFVYDWEDTIKKFMEEEGDNYVIRYVDHKEYDFDKMFYNKYNK